MLINIWNLLKKSFFGVHPGIRTHCRQRFKATYNSFSRNCIEVLQNLCGYQFIVWLFSFASFGYSTVSILDIHSSQQFFKFSLNNLFTLMSNGCKNFCETFGNDSEFWRFLDLFFNKICNVTAARIQYILLLKNK